MAEHGWTIAGMHKMHKIDSFVRETQRVDGLGIGSPDFLSSISVANWHVVFQWYSSVRHCVHSHFPMASPSLRVHMWPHHSVPFIRTKKFTLTLMSLMGFALRSSRSPVRVQWQVDIKPALHPPHIYLLGMDGTHGEKSFLQIVFITSDVLLS